MFEIRQANKDDILDLVALDDECFDTYYYKKTKFNKLDFLDYLWPQEVHFAGSC